MRSEKRGGRSEEPLGSEQEMMSDTQMLRRATLYEALKDSGKRADADDEHVIGTVRRTTKNRVAAFTSCGAVKSHSYLFK